MKKVFAIVTAFAAFIATAFSAVTFTYPVGEGFAQKSKWLGSENNNASGWQFEVVAGGTDKLTLTGAGPYSLKGSSTDLRVIVKNDCTIVLDGLTISGSDVPVTVESGATLTLYVTQSENTLSGQDGCAGINVRAGANLIIDKVGDDDASCKLTCNGGSDAAGIGANDEGSCGSITINGATVTANAGKEAAGIGGSNKNSTGDVTYGLITINGGIVNAVGNDRGAGIGTGVLQKSGVTATAEGIVINGGTVNASTLDARGAPIGLGEVADGTVIMNTITINGGTVNATGDDNRILSQENACAGIGTGIVETGALGQIDEISITGGTVIAQGAKRGAGIGSGEALNNASNVVASISITGGDVTATGGSEAPGIGAGCAAMSVIGTQPFVTIDEISITGGTVVARKGDANATGDDIGRVITDSNRGSTILGTVLINGGSLSAGTTATGATNGSRNDLHIATITNSDWADNAPVTIVGLPNNYGTEGIVADATHSVYPFLPAGTYAFNANGLLYEVDLTDGNAVATIATATGMTIDGVDIAAGSGEGWFYDGSTLTIDPGVTAELAGSSRLPVKVVLGNGADLTVDGVTIAGVAGAPAITTAENASATVRLEGVNRLTGGTGAAAIQPAAGSTITIIDGAEAGVGKLVAQGGNGAAGIGAGATGNAGNIVIAGGIVEANGGADAAGIGAGEAGNCGTISITGGTVEATRGSSFAKDLGNGENGTCSGTSITGGSVRLANGTALPVATTLESATGHSFVLHNSSWTEGEPLAITGAPAGYGTNDICANANKDIFMWADVGDYAILIDDVWYVAHVTADTSTGSVAQFAEIPVAVVGLAYTGAEQTGVASGTGCSVVDGSATDSGHYTATATLASGYLWSDHTVAAKSISWSIAPAIIPASVGTIVYDAANDAWVVTATNDIAGTFEIPDNLGNVVFDLNGHDITGPDADGETTFNGGAAISMTHVADGTGTTISFVDNSDGDKGVIRGGNGADGTASNPAGGNGGIGINITDDAVNPSVTIGSGVAVLGGEGGDAYANSGANGGNGGAGIVDNSGTGTGTPLDSDIDNNGTISGGNGGNGADSADGNAGNGGNGGAGVNGAVDDNTGTISGGNAGNGGAAPAGEAGDGGNGGAGVTSTVDTNDGTITGGNAGNGGNGSEPGSAGTAGNATPSAPVSGEGTTQNGTAGTAGSVTLSTPVPVSNLVYNGEPQSGVPAGAGYTLSGTTTATDPGVYTATATLDDGYAWADGTTEPKVITWTIAPAIIDPADGTVIYDPTADAWVVTLDNDVDGTVEIPDNLGAVIIDLNGHDINGTDADGVNTFDGGAAISITHVADGEGTELTVIDDSDGDKGSLIGGAGADGTSEHPAGGNGGEGIAVLDNAVSDGIVIGTGVTVLGGEGGDAYPDSGANGGNGGAGVLGDVDSNDGTISGGAAGDGADSENGPAGNGGNGGAGVTGDVDDNGANGTITGGAAGNGGDSENGAAGNGGAGGAGVTGDVDDNAGTITGGAAGNGGDSDEAAAGNGGNGGAGVNGAVDNNDGAINGGNAGNGGTGTTAGTAGVGGTAAGTGPASGEGTTQNGTAGTAGTTTLSTPVPVANLIYTGEPQTGVAAGTGYTLTGTTTATEPGVYTATATLDDGYAWADGTTEPKVITWTIAPAIIDPADGTVTYDPTADAWVVTLDNDVDGTVEIPDNLGAVIIDLNGHDINGTDADGVNTFDGGAAIAITHVTDGEGTALTVTDGSDGDKGSLIGGNGADGTSEHPAGGNGGEGIAVLDNAVSDGIVIGTGVTVLGGEGGDAYPDSGANGGNGGAGVLGDVDSNDGTITGGAAGDGADSENGPAGNGGNGGAGVTGDVDDNGANGTITGGAAGNGGDSEKGAAGNGGAGGAGVSGTVDNNDGAINGGAAGNGGDGTTAGTAGVGGGAAGTGPATGTGTTGNGNNGTAGKVVSNVNPQGGADWLNGNPLRVTAISADGENTLLTFTVPVQEGLSFANWVELSVTNHKLAVLVADSMTALQSANVASLLNGGSAEGVKVVFVGKAACSSSAAELVSSQLATSSVTIRAPKGTGTISLYRIYILD